MRSSNNRIILPIRIKGALTSTKIITRNGRTATADSLRNWWREEAVTEVHIMVEWGHQELSLMGRAAKDRQGNIQLNIHNLLMVEVSTTINLISNLNV